MVIDDLPKALLGARNDPPDVGDYLDQLLTEAADEIARLRKALRQVIDDCVNDRRLGRVDNLDRPCTTAKVALGLLGVGAPMSGIEAIAAERKRQVEAEGWSPEHDDQHTDCSLALAAALYATPVTLVQLQIGTIHVRSIDPWPWKDSGINGSWNCWDKRSKHSYRRRLVIAGALLAAEIDRYDREVGRQSPTE